MELGMKLRTGFLWTQTPQVCPGSCTGRDSPLSGSGEEGRRTSSSHSLFLASEAEICMLTRSATSRTVARQGPLSMGFPSKILEPVAICSSREGKLRTSD